LPQNVYECMFILDSNRYARDPNGVSGGIPKMIEQHGGEVLVSRPWSEQKLAYPIKGHHKGTYWLTYFRLESSELASFNRDCQLNDAVLRHLTLKVEPRLVDVLVAHAQGTGAMVSEESEGGAPEEEVADSLEPGEPVGATEGAASQAGKN
jgi:small subunit ribosomal protein S6